MKVSFLSVNETALMTGLSQIQIFALLRNNVIKSSIINDRIVIEQRILNRWISKNTNLVTELKKDVDNRVIYISLLNYVSNYKKKRVS